MRRLLTLALFVTALPLAGGCSGCNKSATTTPRISGGGATFVDPLMQKWSGEYKSAKKVEIDYVAKGSGAGITGVTNKTLDFACSDAPMNAKEVKAAKDSGGEVVHVPVAIGAVAVIYNLDGIKDLKLSGEVLAEIYLRKITKWNDPKVAALNPGVAMPDRDITPACRAESSGTEGRLLARAADLERLVDAVLAEPAAKAG